jgi:oligoendopeptidase F
MTSTVQALPHWDMSVIFPSLDSPEFAQAFEDLVMEINRLAASFDSYNVAEQEQRTLDEATVHVFDTLIAQYNDLLSHARTIGAYIHCFVTTDSRDTLAQAKLSEFQQQMVRLTQLGTRWTAWIGSLDVETLIEQSPHAKEHAFMLRRTKQRAEHLMSPAEESLAAELNVSGGSAWGKLHSNLTSQLTVTLELDGREQRLPMSAVRNLAFDADRDIRRRAYAAELATWQEAALPLAAALNSIKGEVNTLAQRRGWESALDVALWDNSIDRQTLDAMMAAAQESFPDFRRYLQAKAHLLGTPKLAWYDMFAPIGENPRVWEWDNATNFIVEQFGQYSERMCDFAARAFAERWVDAEPRPGKRDGAFCIWLRGDESRVLANYKPAFAGVRTLAHELGHGYHNFNLAHRTMLQRSTPMTMAETASIFCETIVRQAALREANEEEQLAILEASLEAACQVVVDISSRFLFEQRIFERRQQRELSVDEFNQLMLQAQRETYGDGLDESTYHPYMWAVKLHYYSTSLSFYNFPYMFGLLFGLGLYARYEQDPETFKAGYDDLLSSTGLDDAATLAQRFGIDIRTPDFWRSSLQMVRNDIDRFVALVG